MSENEYIEKVLGLDRFPSIDASGSVSGMKKNGIWRKSDVTVKINGYIYNLGTPKEDVEGRK